MSHPIRRHLSFANITSLCALVFAMGGTSYALSIPKNSIGSAQIKKGTVANSDLRANAVTSAKVKNGSLLAADFLANQLPRGATGATGPRGPQGVPGTPGTPGVPGATGTTGAATVQMTVAAADLANSTNQSYSAFCPAGKQAIAGGGRGDDMLSEETILTNTRPANERLGPGAADQRPELHRLAHHGGQPGRRRRVRDQARGLGGLRGRAGLSALHDEQHAAAALGPPPCVVATQLGGSWTVNVHGPADEPA